MGSRMSGSDSWAISRTVDELDHRVHDRLGVDHHVDRVVGHAEQLVGLDDLEPLVHERRGVDRDLRTHAPGRVGQRLVDCDRRQLVARPSPERPARRREQQAGHAGRAVPPGRRSARPAGTGGWRSARSRRGRSRHPGCAARVGRPGAAAMIDSLLASARRRPAARAARVTGRPAKPTTAVHHHVGPAAAAATSPSGPPMTSVPAGTRLGQLVDERRVADGHHLGVGAAAPGRRARPPSAGRRGPPPRSAPDLRRPRRRPGCRSSPSTRPGSPS